MESVGCLAGMLQEHEGRRCFTLNSLVVSSLFFTVWVFVPSIIMVEAVAAASLSLLQRVIRTCIDWVLSNIAGIMSSMFFGFGKRRLRSLRVP